MCNACGFLCCPMDTFDSCGCDGCPYSECWDIDENDFDDGDDFDFDFPRYRERAEVAETRHAPLPLFALEAAE